MNNRRNHRRPVALRRAHRDDLTEAFVRLVHAQERGTIESFAVGDRGVFQIYFRGPGGGRAGTVALDAAGVLEFTDRS